MLLRLFALGFLILTSVCLPAHANQSLCPDYSIYNASSGWCEVPATFEEGWELIVRPYMPDYGYKVTASTKQEALQKLLEHQEKILIDTRPASQRNRSVNLSGYDCTGTYSYRAVSDINSGGIQVTSRWLETRSGTPHSIPDVFTYCPGAFNVIDNVAAVRNNAVNWKPVTKYSCPNVLYPTFRKFNSANNTCGRLPTPKTQPKVCEGNPVSVSDGVKLHTETVYHGTGQHPLKLTLTYNSEQARWGSTFDLFLNTSTMKLRDLGGHYRHFKHEGEYQLFGKQRKVWRTSGSQDVLFEDMAGYWQLYRSSGQFEIYDNTGYLRQISFGDMPTIVHLNDDIVSLQPSGIAHSFNYIDNKISQITHTNGRKLAFDWADDRIYSATDSAGKKYLFSYTAQGMLTQISRSNGQSKTFLYEDNAHPGALTGISIDNVRYAWYEYDEQGKAITSRHFEDSDKHTFDYGTTYTKVANPLHKLTTYHYADISSGKLANIEREQSSYCGGGAQNYTYDSEDRKQTVTDWNGNTTRFSYYDNDKIASITEADGTALARQTKYEWQPEGNKLIAIERDGVRQSFSYDDRGKLTAETITSNGLSRTTHYSYEYFDNHIIQALTVTDANNHSTEYRFDNQGNLLTEISATGELTTYAEYDALGNVGQISYPDGKVLRLTYDNGGKVLAEHYHSSGVETVPYQSHQYSYNRFGEVSTLIATPGSTTQYFYDLNGRLAAERSLLNNSNTALGAILYQRDKLGNVVQQSHYTDLQMVSSLCKEGTDVTRILITTEPLTIGSTIQCAAVTGVSETFRQHYAYTELGKLREITDADRNVIASYSYDANGNMTAMTDALGNNTTYQYDALNRLISEQAPDESTTAYNWQGDVLNKVTDSHDNTTEYQLSALQDVDTQISPDSGTTGYEYDMAGNVIASTDARGIRTAFSYDADGRLLSKTNSSVHNWQYNNTTGQLSGITDDSGSTSWLYNTAGQLSSQTAVIDGSSYALNWAYDSYQRPSSLTYPGGNQVSYEYNTANQLSAVTVTINGQQLNLLSNISTLPFGPIAGWQYGNGLNRSYSYDLNYRLTGINTAGIQQLDYSYSNNQISGISNLLDTAQNQSFSYDSLSRLTSISSSANGQDDYSYDSLGNRVSRSGSVSEAYDIDPLSNRLLAVSRGEQQRSFSYDANGNVISDTGFAGSVRSYGYNDDNRLIAVDSISAGNSTYQYNALGQRVAKTVAGVSTHFIYSPQGQLLAEGATKQYIFVYGQLVGYISNNQLYYVHNDHLGRPEVITDANHAIVWQAKLEAFDRSVLHSAIGDFNIGFPGQYWDEEKQSWYNYFRDYDATTGRYLQSDPLGLFDGPNTYGYAHQNPVMKTDPKGLWVPQVAGGIGGFAFGLWSAIAQGQTGWCAIRSGLYAGAAGVVSGGGSVVTAMLVSGALSVAEQSGRNGFSDVNYLEAGANGLTAGLGGKLGGLFSKWKYPVNNHFPKRSKWNPKYWGEKLGLNDPLPPIDLNQFDRDVMTGALGGAIEHGANAIRPSAGGGSCGCN